MGSEQSVAGLSGKDGRRFLDTRYTPGRIVLYCVDSAPEEKNLRILERHFGQLALPDEAPGRTPPPPLQIFDETRDRGHQQANTILGTRLFPRTDPRRHALFLFNNLLGGPGMNSRLNRQLRERRGLVYTVDSASALMSDCGALMIYFGSQPDAVEKCRRIIREEIDRLASSTLSERAFTAARDQYCGQLLVSGDHRENNAMALAKSMLYFGEVHDIAFTAERIREITALQLREVAEFVASQPLCRLTIS